ncbi:hypothetical protein [Dyella sp.]|jgi:hypothetical protein|uniref:hypothetical protein n=1 Tax=Dyella sp. TaxID=1869338 RepID=UPI002FDB270F
MALSPKDTVHFTIADIAVAIPSRDEHIRILKRFGRPKDLARAELLRALCHGAPTDHR